MRIRPATGDDLETIVSIVLECDPTTSSREYEAGKAHDAVSLPTRRTTIAEVDGEPAGYASVDLTDPELAHLSRLFVRPEHWGSGVATALHADALAVSAPRMRLFTPSGNARARRFYEREGWTACGTARHAELGIELTEYRRDP